MTGAIFVDTSALFAVLDADDDNHQRALRAWNPMLDQLEADPGAAITHTAASSSRLRRWFNAAWAWTPHAIFSKRSSPV